jgi:hypothetical protein
VSAFVLGEIHHDRAVAKWYEIGGRGEHTNQRNALERDEEERVGEDRMTRR